ncbi:hypothetical protein QYE76_007507 [Lolium multiflorum]|uniref:Uncharacterized protein n=1 Tax=Lolium multiflorum TaxID=4521 RepID=A0AAD8RYI4_LOLMU|nr:hypothetical protein QYE76_007507 [Lolium multiflorum]
MASSSFATALATALGAPPTQPLTRDNALVWRALVIPALCGAWLLDLVEGKDPAPDKIIEAEDDKGMKVKIPNPNYASWIARDQQVLRWLLNSLSPDVLTHVIGLDTSAETWAAVNTHVSTSSKSRIQHLRAALVETKKNDMSAEKYFSKMQTIAQELAAAGKPLDDDELVWLMRFLASTHLLILPVAEVVLPPMVRTAGKTTVVGMTTVVLRITEAGVMTTMAGAMSAPATVMMMVAVMMMAAAVMEVVETVVVTKVATKTVVLADVMMQIDVMMVGGVVIASPLAMSTPPARFVISMGIRQRTVGGAMEIIVVTMESVETMVQMQILHLMMLTPTGTTILALLIISPIPWNILLARLIPRWKLSMRILPPLGRVLAPAVRLAGPGRRVLTTRPRPVLMQHVQAGPRLCMRSVKRVARLEPAIGPPTRGTGWPGSGGTGAPGSFQISFSFAGLVRWSVWTAGSAPRRSTAVDGPPAQVLATKSRSGHSPVGLCRTAGLWPGLIGPAPAGPVPGPVDRVLDDLLC